LRRSSRLIGASVTGKAYRVSLLMISSNAGVKHDELH
jgi:hypothetical protein